jgi:hypothetical protein
MKAVLKLILPSLVMTAFALNALLTIGGWQATSSLDENRELAPPPKWNGSITQYVRQADAWLTDNFAFRKPLVEAFNSHLYHELRSTMAKNVIIGTGPWIFGADFDGQASVSPPRLTPYYLARAKQALTERKNWLEARGIHMLVMFMPTKTSIYGSRFLPSYWRFNETEPTPSEQLYEYLGKDFTRNVVPVRARLTEVSLDHEVYYHTDTHATQFGTYVAYDEMARHIGSYVPDRIPAPYPEFDLKQDKLEPTGFGRLMGVPFTDFSLVPVPKTGYSHLEVDPVAGADLLPAGTRVTYYQNPKVRRNRIVVIGDSFTNRMPSILGEVFSESVVLNMNNVTAQEARFPAAFLDRFRPDFVLLMYVDTRLTDCPEGCGEFPTSNPPELKGGYLVPLSADPVRSSQTLFPDERRALDAPSHKIPFTAPAPGELG